MRLLKIRREWYLIKIRNPNIKETRPDVSDSSDDAGFNIGPIDESA